MDPYRGERQSRWFLEKGRYYRPNPSSNNLKIYYEIEKAISSQNTNDLDENTKDLVIRARLEEDRKLADRKREIIQSFPANNDVQRPLTEMSSSVVEPSQVVRNQRLQPRLPTPENSQVNRAIFMTASDDVEVEPVVP